MRSPSSRASSSSPAATSELAAPGRDVPEHMKRGDPGGDTAPAIGESVARQALRLRPRAPRPRHVREVRRHVVTVVPELDALRKLDAVAEPALRAVIFDQDRGA